jgi:hypothetical protein
MMALYFGMGIGLLILALAGLGKQVPGWAGWITFGIGVASMIAGAAAFDVRERRWLAPVGFFLAMAAMWVMELATGVESWFTWVSFAAALIYLGSAAAAQVPRGTLRPQVPVPG